MTQWQVPNIPTIFRAIYNYSTYWVFSNSLLLYLKVFGILISKNVQRICNLLAFIKKCSRETEMMQQLFFETFFMSAIN